MGKYANLDSGVYSIFGQSSWTAVGIKTFPANINVRDAGIEFIRVSVIPSGYGVNLKSISGVIIVDIFVEANKGPKRASFIADKLDTFLSGKSITVATGIVVQLDRSAVSPNGLDSDNPSLYRTTYTIPFNYFEVM